VLEALSMLGMTPSEEVKTPTEKEPSHPNIQNFMRTA
jgi:hypothetical protein